MDTTPPEQQDAPTCVLLHTGTMLEGRQDASARLEREDLAVILTTRKNSGNAKQFWWRT
jgi:hypothetical protein